MKLPGILVLFVLVAGFVACRKETKEPAPPFNPVGYWRGNAAHFHTAILNNAEGKSRIYFRIHGIDTAAATIGDGTYILTGNTFKATYLISNSPVTIFIDANAGQANILTGQLYNSTTPDIVDCILRKQ